MVRVQVGNDLIDQKGVELDALRNRAAGGDAAALAEFWSEIDKVAADAKAKQLDDVGEAMKNIQFEFGAKDLKYLAQQSAGMRDLTSDEARGQEWNRRREFKAATQAAMDTYHARYLPLGWEGNEDSECAYDLIMFVCGDQEMKQSINEKAMLRKAQRAMFTGQQICNYVDTGLLLARHQQIMSTQASKKMASYRAFFHHAQPYLGSDLAYIRQSKAEAFVYGIKLTGTLAPIRPDSKEAYSQLTFEQRTAQGSNPVVAARYNRDGDLSGRIARSNHFAVLEQMLMGDAFRIATGIDWVAMEQQYRRGMVANGGAILGATMAAALEEFDGRLATEYQALLYRAVKRDAGYKGGDGVLPRLPLEGKPPQNAADRQRYPNPTFADILGQPNLANRLRDGGPVPANNREAIARHYVLRAFYTACAWSWFPHSTCCVFLLDALELSATGADFNREHTLVPQTLDMRLAAAADDVAEDIIKAHRTLAKQIKDGTAVATSNSIDQRARRWWRKYRYERQQVAAGDELDQPLRAHAMFEGPVTAAVMEIWDSITLENMYQHRYDIALRSGQVVLIVVGTGGAIYVLYLGGTTLISYLPAGTDVSAAFQAAATSARAAGRAALTYMGNTAIGQWTYGVYAYLFEGGGGAAVAQEALANLEALANVTNSTGPAAEAAAAYTRAEAAEAAARAAANATGRAMVNTSTVQTYQTVLQQGVTSSLAAAKAQRANVVAAAAASAAAAAAYESSMARAGWVRMDAGRRVNGATIATPGPGAEPVTEWVRQATDREVIDAVEQGVVDNGQAPDGHLATGPDAPSMASHGSLHAETQAAAIGMDLNPGVASSSVPPPAEPPPPRRVASDPPPSTPPASTPLGVQPERVMTRAQKRMAQLYKANAGDVLKNDFPTRDKEALRRAIYDTPAGNTRGKRRDRPTDFSSMFYGDGVVDRASTYTVDTTSDEGGAVERAALDLSRMSFATGELTAPSGSFWECGHNLAFRM